MIEQRQIRVPGEGLERLRADPAGEQVVVVAREAHHRQDLAGRRAEYRAFSWELQARLTEPCLVRPAGVIVIEGVCALSPIVYDNAAAMDNKFVPTITIALAVWWAMCVVVALKHGATLRAERQARALSSTVVTMRWPITACTPAPSATRKHSAFHLKWDLPRIATSTARSSRLSSTCGSKVRMAGCLSKGIPPRR